jgi:hypothetical protein
MDRAKAAQMTIISPEGLRVRADAMRKRGDESCARHLELAADALAGPSPRDPLDDPSFQALSFQIDTTNETRELRLAIYRDRDQKSLLGYMVLTSPEVYELGTDLIRYYDQLEGI